MARRSAPYTPEFRRQMIELVRSGRSPESLSKEFEPTAQAIRNWFAQAERDAGRRRDEDPRVGVAEGHVAEVRCRGGGAVLAVPQGGDARVGQRLPRHPVGGEVEHELERVGAGRQVGGREVHPDEGGLR